MRTLLAVACEQDPHGAAQIARAPTALSVEPKHGQALADSSKTMDRVASSRAPAVVPGPLQQQVEERVQLIRGTRVMLDADLAALYGVTTKALNQAVARNAKRFPGDFAFRLSAAEADS
jgi:hypothetical protein